MKKLITTLALTIIFGSAFSQKFYLRTYPNCKYTVNMGREKKESFDDVKILWKDNDASTLDNVDFVAYPGGHVIVKTYPKYSMNLKDGTPVYESKGTDEGDREVDISFVKINERKILIMVWYSKYLSYIMAVNLENFMTTESGSDNYKY